MFEWVQEADKKGVKVVFVADSCHSGGMERSASAPGVRFRKMETLTIAADQLHLPPPEISKLTEDDFDNVTFVAAVAEDKLTPEVTIDGRKRGALSWAFARALEGRADKDGDGQVSELELLGYVVPAVHAQVESQQTPQVLPLRARCGASHFARGQGAGSRVGGLRRPQAQGCGGGRRRHGVRALRRQAPGR
jgi:hypothetical protein